MASQVNSSHPSALVQVSERAFEQLPSFAQQCLAATAPNGAGRVLDGNRPAQLDLLVFGAPDPVARANPERTVLGCNRVNLHRPINGPRQAGAHDVPEIVGGAG